MYGLGFVGSSLGFAGLFMGLGRNFLQGGGSGYSGYGF